MTNDDCPFGERKSDGDRYEEITALKNAGLATWDEERELFQIRRRSVIGDVREKRLGRALERLGLAPR